VNTVNPSINPVPHSDWQIIGTLELQDDLNTDDTIAVWLLEFLKFMNLHTDFSSKLLRSAQEAISRSRQNEKMTQFKHTSLTVLVLTDRGPNDQSWGFFRIEKIGSETEGFSSDHTIEIYLYQEGG